MNFELSGFTSSNDLLRVKNLDDNIVQELSESKSLLDKHVKDWEIVKKIIHDYEYVYTSPSINRNIGKIIPISRSYFKMKEILQEFKLISDNQLKLFCMAEAPGGFIQSFLEHTENINSIGAMTLLSDDKSIPYWNKNIKKSGLITFYEGINKNGDLCDFKNIISVIKRIGRNSIDILTGDGGFDYSKNYNKQEYNSLPLIYSEIFMALNLQKAGGSFVCKVFDIFLKETIQLVYILYLSYDEIYIYKPCLSRLSNSEKYLVCKGFKGYNQELINKLCRSFHNKDLDLLVDTEFNDKIKQFNLSYTTKQIKQIQKGMNMIYRNIVYKYPNEKQISTAINWCKKYNIPINNYCFYLKRTISPKRLQWGR